MRTNTVRTRKLIISIATLVIGLLAYYYQKPIQKAVTSAPSVVAGDYTVTKAVDGDTIVVKMGDKNETIRLIGVDTPETHDPRKSVQCFGQQASAKTKEWTLGKTVRLEADPNDSDRDKYGRLLRYVYVGDELINAKLIREGYGFAYVVFPFEKLDEFRQLESEARAAGRGLWGGCSVDDSSKVKQTNNAQ